MTTIAQTYVGNCFTDAQLQERVEQARQQQTCLEVSLSQHDVPKGRIHAHTTSGMAVGIIKERDRPLQAGDVFQTETGQLLLVHLAAQTVMVLSFTGEAAGHELELIHLGHVLGNHHWAILVQRDRIYVQLAVDPAVVEATVRGFNIPHLCVSYESRLADQHLTFSHHTHDEYADH
jgi:urease accessory protein